jgi:plasmid stability protein
MADTDTSVKAILIRDVPDELHRIMKASAAMSGMSLQAWCLDILKSHVGTQVQSGARVTLVMSPAPAHSPAEGNQTATATPGPA